MAHGATKGPCLFRMGGWRASDNVAEVQQVLRLASPDVGSMRTASYATGHASILRQIVVYVRLWINRQKLDQQHNAADTVHILLRSGCVISEDATARSFQTIYSKICVRTLDIDWIDARN